MENTYKVLAIVAVLVISLFVGYAIAPSGYDDQYVQTAIDNAQSELQTSFEAQLQQTVSNKDSQIADLQQQVTSLQVQATEEPGTPSIENGESYLLDEMYLDTVYPPKTISDRELSKLVDSNVDFDGNDYDVEEVFTLNGFELAINGDDYAENVYLSVPVDGLEYSVVLDSSLDVSTIGDDEEYLTIPFLGSEIEITKWDGSEVTLMKGEEYLLDQGESVTVGDKTLTVSYVMDGSVYLTVGDSSKEVEEDEVKTIGGLEVEVKDVIYSEVGPVTKVVLRVGDEVKKVVESGEEYEEDSPWEWVVDDHKIGLKLSEEFKYLDDDDGFNALAKDETLSLPNDYITVKYNGIADEDFEEYSFRLKSNDIVEIKGNFQSSLNDYDRIYFNGTNFAEDDDFEDLVTDLYLGDSEVSLTFNGFGNLIIGGDESIVVKGDLKDISVDGSLNTHSIKIVDEDYRTSYGTIIKNPEDSTDNQRITLTVPMEQLEGSISLY